MSKKRAAASDQPAEITPGFERSQLGEVSALIQDVAAMTAVAPDLPHGVDKSITTMVGWAAAIFQHIPEFAGLRDDQLDLVYSFARYCATQGFVMALYRYADELKAVPELSAWNRKRAAGAERGRKVQQTKKANRIGRIQSMLNSGMEPNAIAAQLGCSISTVYRALKPATSKPRKASKRSRKR